MTYRSTTLSLLDRHCPRAIDFAESGAFRDREFFQAGIAAHAILQAIGEAGPYCDQHAIAESVVRELVTKGRAFDGKPEPPISPKQATDGRDIALLYLLSHNMPEGAKYEAGLAVDKDWQPVPYGSPKAYYCAAIDVIEVKELADDDGYPVKVVKTSDWKSAWPTNAGELDTIQIKGQAAIAAAHYPDATVIIRSAVNLRTGASYESETIMDDDGLIEVARWRADIAHAIAAAEVRQSDGNRPVRPGAGCMGCPYLMQCPESMPKLTNYNTPEDIAQSWLVIEAWRADYLPKLKALCAESTIVLEDCQVGYSGKVNFEPATTAPNYIAAEWFNGEATDAEVGLLTALKLGVSNIDAIAKTLHPFDRSDKDWKTRRAEFLGACLGKKTVSQFGIIE